MVLGISTLGKNPTSKGHFKISSKSTEVKRILELNSGLRPPWCASTHCKEMFDKPAHAKRERMPMQIMGNAVVASQVLI